MAYERVHICDICFGDGIKRLAKATYENDDGEKFACCSTHLEDVKKAKLNYEIIEDE